MKRLTKGGYAYGELIEAGAHLASVVEAIDWNFEGLSTQTIHIDTPYGPLLIQGDGNDELSTSDTPLLLIDTGGNDRYLIPVEQPLDPTIQSVLPLT